MAKCPPPPRRCAESVGTARAKNNRTTTTLGMNLVYSDSENVDSKDSPVAFGQSDTKPSQSAHMEPVRFSAARYLFVPGICPSYLYSWSRRPHRIRRKGSGTTLR